MKRLNLDRIIGTPVGVSLIRYVGSNKHSHFIGDSDKPKRSYTSLKEAIRVAEELYKRNHIPMTVYKCSYCGKIHIGKSKF